MTTVRPLTEADRTQVKKVVAAHFSDEWSYTVVVNDEEGGEYARVAEVNGDIVGAMALTIYDDKAALKDEMYLIDTVEPVPDATRYGLIHMGYVAPEYTGRSVGSTLLTRLHDIGAGDGVDVFVGDAWFHGGQDSPERLLRRHEYDIPFTTSIAGHADGDCPKCPGACVCDAALAVRRLDR